MSTKRDHSNRDRDDHKRQGQNAHGQGTTRHTHASSNADKVPGKSARGDQSENRENHRSH